jgi:hypothetical protein
MIEITEIIARAIYEEPAQNSGCCAPWNMLREDRKAYWLDDASRIMTALLAEAENKNQSVGEFARKLEATYSLAVSTRIGGRK